MANFLAGSFSNGDNVRAPNQFRRETQIQHLKIHFFLKNISIHFHRNSTSVITLDKRNQLSFSTVSCRSDLSSEANSSCCQKSDAWSHSEQRLLSSAWIAILQRTSSGRSLIYRRKSVGPIMEPWGIQH